MHGDCFSFTCFNTQPPEGGWQALTWPPITAPFQHTAARRRLESATSSHGCRRWFQHTAARRRLAKRRLRRQQNGRGFNTQPPEGGWKPPKRWRGKKISFNTQPPEGGWGIPKAQMNFLKEFQHTAARRRLAIGWLIALLANWFQHTAARRRLGRFAQMRSK